jgi:predicted phage tail protein
MNLVYANGEYALKPVKEESFTSAFDFNKDNMIGKVTTSLGSKQSRFNRMKVNFFNPDLEWQPDNIIIENATYLAEDGGIVNEKTVDLPMTGSTTDANDLATRIGTYYLDLSRHQTIMSFKASHEALKLNVGDPVTVTHDVYNFSAEKFRVNSITLFPDATVDVILEQYAPDATYLEKD